MEARFISIKGAREHNLKDVSVRIPIGKITLVRGDSGSGKSTLIFDVLYGEARRKYFAAVSHDPDMIGAPAVDLVEPVLAAVALRQHSFNRNPRSLVSKVTGIGRILRSVFELTGELYCPGCGSRLDVRTRLQVLDELKNLEKGTKLIVKAFLGRIPKSPREEVLERLKKFAREGFLRCEVDGKMFYLEDFTVEEAGLSGDVYLVIDRIIKKPGFEKRVADSLRQAVEIHGGMVQLDILTSDSSSFDNATRVIRFSEMPRCFDCGAGPPDTGQPGNGPFQIIRKVSGLSMEEVEGMGIDELVPLIKGWISSWQKKRRPEFRAAVPACREILNRLNALQEMGMGYLALDTPVPMLSSGEGRKLMIASLLFQKMTGVLFVLDEPLSCLGHEEQQVIRQKILELRKQANTVVVVEHDKVLMEEYADWLIEIGPRAGEHGGEIVFQGRPGQRKGRIMAGCQVGAARKTLSRENGSQESGGRGGAEVFPDSKVTVKLRKTRNLKEQAVTLPVGGITGVYGPSGSGKSALATAIFQGLTEKFGRNGPTDSKRMRPGSKVLFMDEKLPVGSRVSVIATFMGVYGHIASIISRTPEARARGITRGYLSLVRKGGRCEKCKGLGKLVVEPDFLQPVEFLCDACQGKRFSTEVLSIRYKGANISDLLELTVSEAIGFFKSIKAVRAPFEALERTGLGYLRLGQPVSSLSGGERQRLKLASVIARRQTGGGFIILDNVSRGLSDRDLLNLVRLFWELVESGHSLVLVDNHEMILEYCSWLIRMGPGSGPQGGRIISQGPTSLSGTDKFLPEYRKLLI